MTLLAASDHSRSRWLWAGLAAAAPVMWFVLRKRKPKQYHDTGFERFLKQQVVTEDDSRGFTFDSFLKVNHQQQDSCCFESFLKGTSNAVAVPAVAVPEKKQLSAEELGRKKRVLVMFGTEYGFAKEIGEKLCSQLEKHDAYWPVLLNMADHPEGYDFSKEQAVFMICSTQGDGVPPTEARDFCEWLFAGKAPQLGHLQYSVCALGDTSYTHFCRCGKQLDAAMKALGANEAVPRSDINKEDWLAVNSWMDAVCQVVLSAPLKTAAEMGFVTGGATAQRAVVKRWSKNRPYYARVAAVSGLCNVSSRADKETVRVELDLGDSGLEYLPGDALGIYASNAPEAVDELLAQLGADAQQPVPIPSWHYEEVEAARQGYSDTHMPLRQALVKCYDLRSPKQELLQLLLAASKGHGWAEEEPEVGAGDCDQIKAVNGRATAHLSAAAGAGAQPCGKHHHTAAERLRQLLADQQAMEGYLAQRHVVDILQDFRPAALTAAQVLPALRQLQPRLYSISSSPLEDARGVQATIAVVRYECLGKERIGVCSTYVAERMEVGSSVPVFISKSPDFRLPQEPQAPIIMVGPGTGLAPFRAFILQRQLQAQRDGSSCGQMVLYFGCRRSDQDYLYGQDLEAWAQQATITLFTAFSRMPGQPKVYVQQRLRESGDLVWRLLQAGGHFYVCGDAGSMAGQVEEALLQIIEHHQGQGPEAAREYLQQLSQLDRYQRDVWFS